jgi:hypothetical protein
MGLPEHLDGAAVGDSGGGPGPTRITECSSPTMTPPTTNRPVTQCINRSTPDRSQRRTPASSTCPHIKVGGTMAHLAVAFTICSGQVRMVHDGLHERQSDGAVLRAVEQSGIRDVAVSRRRQPIPASRMFGG